MGGGGSRCVLSCVIPDLDSPVSPAGGKHILVEGIPANSMYRHVVGLGGGGGGGVRWVVKL